MEFIYLQIIGGTCRSLTLETSQWESLKSKSIKLCSSHNDCSPGILHLSNNSNKNNNKKNKKTFCLFKYKLCSSHNNWSPDTYTKMYLVNKRYNFGSFLFFRPFTLVFVGCGFKYFLRQLSSILV
jgi:hypothetical protein